MSPGADGFNRDRVKIKTAVAVSSIPRSAEKSNAKKLARRKGGNDKTGGRTERGFFFFYVKKQSVRCGTHILNRTGSASAEWLLRRQDKNRCSSFVISKFLISDFAIQARASMLVHFIYNSDLINRL